MSGDQLGQLTLIWSSSGPPPVFIVHIYINEVRFKFSFAELASEVRI